MQSDFDVMHDVVTGGRSAFPTVIPRTPTSAENAREAQSLHTRVRHLQEDVSETRRRTLLRELDERQEQVAVRGGPELLSTLADAGFAWRDIARLTAVTVPAVQKWRRGTGISPENRLRLARLVALREVANDRLITEPTSWLEMPVKDRVKLSRLDLLAGDRFDLVLELMSNDAGPVAPDGILDEFDPLWRERYVDDKFEVFLAEDGIASIRPVA